MLRREFLGAIPAVALAQDRSARIRAAADRLTPYLIEQRRDFHMHPELMYEEVRTARVVAERLRKIGVEEIRTGLAKTGVTGVIRGAKPGPCVALRADMDALPIDESAQNIPYKSTKPGVKHACGHDAHTTMLLGAAEILMAERASFSGAVKLIFQPAEEGGRGAQKMIEDGALDGPKVEAIIGQHVWPNTPTGAIDYAPGAFMASGDFFTITIRGKSAHGARPEDGIDAVYIASQCVNALQSVRSRRISTADQMVLSIGSIHGGTAANIISDTVVMKGTLRTLNGAVRDRAITLMHQALDGVTKGLGGSYEMSVADIGTVTYNEPKLVERVLPSLKKVVGAANAKLVGPQMVAEDFSYYQAKIPGFFYFLGVRNEAKGFVHAVHTPEFDLDEAALPIGAALLATSAVDWLAGV